MSQETVTQFFARDHDRLEDLFAQFRGLKSRDLPAATVVFRRFQRGLLKHLGLEDEIMFPMYEARAGTGGQQPLDRMHEEHRRIEELVAALNEKVGRQDLATEPEESKLESLLTRHHHGEEIVVYPLIDDTLSDADRERLFARIGERL